MVRFNALTFMFVVDSAVSGVLNKIKGDLTTPDNCLSLTTLTTPSASSISSIAAYASPPTATIVGTYINLLPTEKIYGEIINFSLLLGFGFRSAENLNCAPPPCVFSTPPAHV